jgi:hypothetical protein
MINLEDYFEKGYSITTLSNDILPKLWLEIYGVNWISDNSSVYKSTPEWYVPTRIYQELEEDGEEQNLVERAYGDDLIKNAPDSLKQIANEIIHQRYFDPLRSLKHKSTLKYLHLWNGSEDIPWHMDTIDSSDTLIFIYLTEELFWQSEWGGSLGIRKELNNAVMYETTVLPNSGTMVIINNTNPLIKHKVWSLQSKEVNRYTFSMCFTWE